MNENVQNRFNTIAAGYIKTRRKFVPDFDNFYRSGICLLQCEKPDPRVLDLGAGTGLYTLKLLVRYPQAKVTLIDFAGNMLDIARDIFEGNSNIGFIQDDYSSHDFAGDQYDIVISALSIHHFGDDDKKNVYQRVYSLLSDHGEFLNADQISADSESFDQKYRDIHAKFVKENASESEYDKFVKNIALDRRSPVLPQLNWLRTVGFTQVDCVFKLYCFAVMYGKK